MTTDNAFGAIILGGGRSRRLGCDKASVVVGGHSLLAHAVEAAALAERVVVVAAPDVMANAFPSAAPAGVEQVLENPPFGGPVAGIVAGVKCFGAGEVDRIAVLSCDVLGAKQAMRHLSTVSLDNDGRCAVDAEGYPQYLLATYRTEFLKQRCLEVGRGRDLSVRAFFAPANLEMVQMGKAETQDIDTPNELQLARQQYLLREAENDQ